MDAIKPCAACSDASARRCDASSMCGCVTPVVFVPVPVLAPDVCRDCRRTCTRCGINRKRETDEDGQARDQSRGCGVQSTSNEDAAKPPDSTGRNFCACECLAAANHGMRYCAVGGRHPFHLPANHGLALYPAVTTCCAHGHAARNVESGNLDGGKRNAQAAEDAREQKANKDFASESTTQRRLSADSGRVTWSDSGESLFSDTQGGDSLRRSGKAVSRPRGSTSQPRLARTPTPLTLTPTTSGAYAISEDLPQTSRGVFSEISLRGLISPTYLDRKDACSFVPLTLNQRAKSVLLPRALAGTRQNAEDPQRRSVWSQTTIDNRLDKQRPKSKELIANTTQAESWAASESPGPRRANSECTLRKVVVRRVPKPTGGKLDRLAEGNTPEGRAEPKLPRSRSLFVRPQMTPNALTPTSRSRQASEVVQLGDIDFKALGGVVRKWEIGGDAQSKEGLKPYGLAAVPSINGFAVTDATKTTREMVKIFGADGKKQASFGTPTWPRCGRGVALTPDGKHLAVCHLSEICVYTLKGEVVDRLGKDHVKACWGIAINAEGNFVVTDPKSSAVITLTPSGEEVERIGQRTIVKPTFQKKSKSRTSLSWKASKSRLSLGSKRQKASEKEAAESEREQRISSLSLPIVTVEHNSSELSVAERNQVRLLTPRYVAVNSKNQVLVTDTKQRCLLVFEKDGTLVASIGGGRLGCGNCQYDDETSDIANRMERWPLGTVSSPIAEHGRPMTRNKSDPVINRLHTSKSERSQSTSYCSGVLCTLKGSCGRKTRRPKASGAVHRGELGRNESVESEAYQIASYSKTTKGKSELASDRPPVPSTTAEEDKRTSQSRPRVDVPESIPEPVAKSGEKSTLKQMARSMKTTWLRGRSRRKTKNSAPAEIDRCDSLTSLSVGDSSLEAGAEHAAVGGRERRSSNLSPLPLSPNVKTASTPGATESEFSYVGVKAEENSSQDEETSDDSHLSLGNTHDSDSCPEAEEVGAASEEDDEERAACRRCHVEDPRGVCVDRRDNILLVDRARHRVTVFAPSGHFVRHLLTEHDGINDPMTACVLNDSSIAITDSSSCIKVFQFELDM